MADSGLDETRETVTIHSRVFQKYSIDNTVYCVPIDQVSTKWSSRTDPLARLGVPISSLSYHTELRSNVDIGRKTEAV